MLITMHLLCWRPNWIRSCRLFSLIGDARCYCSSLSSPSDTTRSLSAKGHSRKEHSLSLLRRSLARSLYLDVPTDLSRSPPPAACTLRITLNFSPQKADVAAGRSATCATMKLRPRRHPKQMPPCPLPLGLSAVLHAIGTAAALPPILLLVGRARLVESPRQGGN
jgi:hypothetical protein